jgi:magnesium-transporting ATPase (P-type)
MSVQTPRETGGGQRYTTPSYEDSHGSGWITFAGIMMMVVGIMNVIGGIAAIDNANVYVNNAHYVFSDLNTWGWVILITGAAQILTALGIWARNQFARWLGVLFVSLNALGQLLFLPSFPLWSLALFAVDVLIIYGLVAYGDREPSF